MGKIPVFSAQSNEDASSFIQEFKRSCICNGLIRREQWTEFFPTFLDGSALRWFETLGENVKNSWDLLTESFLE